MKTQNKKKNNYNLSKGIVPIAPKKCAGEWTVYSVVSKDNLEDVRIFNEEGVMVSSKTVPMNILNRSLIAHLMPVTSFFRILAVRSPSGEVFTLGDQIKWDYHRHEMDHIGVKLTNLCYNSVGQLCFEYNDNTWTKLALEGMTQMNFRHI